jgi:hypothetical protein
MSKFEILSARNLYPNTYRLFDSLRSMVLRTLGLHLPDVMLDLSTVKKDMEGYFRNRSSAGGNWQSLSGIDILEIGLNPAGKEISQPEVERYRAKGWAVAPVWDKKGEAITAYTAYQPDKDVLATLLHEMVHLADHVVNNTRRQDIHGKAWQSLMVKVGLEPYPIDEANGRRTNRWSHSIIKDGVFDRWFNANRHIANGISLDWRKTPKRAAKSGASHKFECPRCGATLRGSVEKLEQAPICGICSGTENGMVYYIEYIPDGTCIDRNKPTLKAVIND